MKSLQSFSLKNYMSNNQIVLSSLALDLRRVAQGYFRGSTQMADRFLQEALERKKEAEDLVLEPYLMTLLQKLDLMKNETDEKEKAEDALMYSTLFQNASLRL